MYLPASTPNHTFLTLALDGDEWSNYDNTQTLLFRDLQTPRPKSYFTKLPKYLTVIIVTCILFFICNSWKQGGDTSSCFYQLLCHCHFLLMVGCQLRSVSLEHEYNLGKANFKTPSKLRT
jgi:hypothetical protein